ncbi:Protein borderless [Lucilia cuprina]|nr:Protein borderless [Lucilia cuprina]
MKSKMMIFCHHNGGSYRFFAFLLLLSLFFVLISVSCVSGARHDRQKSTNMEAKVGSYAVFNCYIDFPYDFPIPYVVHWSKDDKKIFTWYEGEASANELYNGRLNIITNHEDYGKATANLTAIRESDQGWYHCQIVFPNRTPSIRNNGTWYYLTVQGGSLIKIPPVNQTIMEGQTAFFHCVMKYPNSSETSWYKDGVILQDIPDLIHRSRLSPQGSLSIDPTMMSDYGEYECHVRSNDDEVQTAKAFLNIQSSWVRNRYLISKSASSFRFFDPQTPSFIRSSDKLVSSSLKGISSGKEDLSLGLKRSDNRASIKDGSPLPEERATIKDGTLTITNLIETDRGMYECVATNEAATITAETELMIENLSPRPPYNLTANSSETTITIRWQPGYLRPNLEYTVWYRLTDAPEWRTMRIVQKNVMEATIQHLQPGREYEFMVLSQDKYGDGMFSKQFRFSTQPSSKVTAVEDNVGVVESTRVEYTQHREPSSSSDNDNTNNNNPLPSTGSLSAPWNLSAINNQQGWLLHWEHPQQGLDMLRLYTVRWWKEPEHHLVGTVETFDNFYQLRHLKEDSTFKVRVLAISADGDQVPSGELIIEVPSQRKMRALLIGSSIGVAFLLCALVAFLYVKRSCLLHLFTGDIGSAGKDVGINDGSIEDGCDSSEHTHDTEKINNT